MAARKETSLVQRSNVILLHKRGETIRKIVETLAIPRSTVSDIITRHKLNENVENRKGRGRKPILSKGMKGTSHELSN